jgi:hypothetical protein
VRKLPDLPRPLDVTLALKAICLSEQLTNSEKRIACILLDHFNARSGRCDPSVQSLALLAGVSDRSVQRAGNKFVRLGMFDLDRNGGTFSTNQYSPVWPYFRTAEAAWSSRKQLIRARHDRSAMSPAPRQIASLRDDSAVTQTSSNNFSHKTSQGLSEDRTTKNDPASRSIAMKGMLHVKRTAAARTEAQRRWDNELLKQCSRDAVQYGKIVEAIDRDLSERATSAELAASGGGFRFLVGELLARGVIQPRSVGGQ